ncbi:hypothetical protein M2451_002633 [Dysgonomonas sp. PFB1-18]|uniref:exodeoxyribonuclease X C-terminal domain-containing protein n=1 Tax=unclassified Dysgonomonas TaxID=2630389 RepID=UPI0024739CF2|nr:MULTISPECIES: hypothetical protein [unclassified Dysgonomonas]MDH6308114.1 hypothetical protein [Dysgonomonas sp. PF1-14]MDH6339653.1 hypothetical protein [Dysgonomonas sp. PF1-16]MDH6381304.1 hypothetical protein [Dysgonomonas sp. PFB1-18]MDH6398516.1 hypothetical protein [Dysgonomonas sp. PF1-23]
MALVIGFASKYYTLWNVVITPQYTTDAYGEHWHTGNHYQYSYMKNISSDIVKVKELYPSVTIDDGLRGITTREWGKTVKINMPPNYLTFGKYTGRTVEDIASVDLQYLIWALDNMYIEPAQKEAICSTKEYKEYQAQIQMEINNKLARISPLKSGKHILTILSNPCEGKAFVNITDGHNIELRFRQTKEYFYNGFPYELPVMAGKAKRVKCKAIEYNLQIINTEINKEDGYCYQIANVID